MKHSQFQSQKMTYHADCFKRKFDCVAAGGTQRVLSSEVTQIFSFQFPLQLFLRISFSSVSKPQRTMYLQIANMAWQWNKREAKYHYRSDVIYRMS